MQRPPTLPALLLASALAGPGCVTSPARDPAGEPGLALAYTLGESAEGVLDCDAGDCRDWYVYGVPEPGYVVVSLELQSASEPPPVLEVAVTDADAEVLATARTGEGRLRQRWILTATPHYFRVAPPAGESATASYTLRTTFEARARPTAQTPRAAPPEPAPAPPPPPPPEERPAPEPEVSHRLVETLLIGIEDGDALLGQGSTGGIRVGLRGRIVEQGRTLAHFEVVEVFPEGSRARLDALPEPPPGPGAKALVELPRSD